MTSRGLGAKPLVFFILIRKLLVWFVVACQQAGTVANQPVVNAVNTRMNAAVVPSPVQASVGNIVVRPSQSTVIVGPTATRPAMSVVSGRMNVPSTNTASVRQSAVPANPSVAGMYGAIPILGCRVFRVTN